MGLCLYLALAERLSEGIMDLVVLDDVVMSIDAGHRRNVSELIARLSDQRQFIITTHDRTWMRQLRSAGVAGSRNTVELRNWHIDTGPVWGWSTDTWQQIDGFLEEGNVSAAAASLRRESEALYGEVCQRLGAKVPCKLEAQWDLGELVSAAQGRFSQLLKKAKSVAQGARDSETLEFLQDLDCTKAAVFGRVGSEQWAVNPAVHYNSWANFELNDFRPVVDAFHRMQRLFMCCHCNSLLYVTYDGGNEQDLRCRCGRISWNLASS